MASGDIIRVPRPEPDEATIVITDADGASASISCKQTDLAELATHLLAVLAEGQRQLHEQRA